MVPSPGRRPQAAAHFLFHTLKIFGAFSEYPVRRDFGPASSKIALADDNAEIGPVPVEGGGRKAEPELDRLSNILKAFNDQFGTLFADSDRVARRIKEDIAPKVAADQSYRNAKQNTPNAARIEHDKALAKVMLTLLKDDTQVYKQFVENESFRRFVTDMVFTLTSD